MSKNESQRNDTVERDSLPHEVYAAHADYVKLSMKTMTARRMIGWLREYAEYADVSGATETAKHSRYVANRLAAEVEPEKVEREDADAIELSDDQRERLEEIKAECTGEGLAELPEPSDEMVVDSLLDTWDAVDQGLYSDGGDDDDAE